MKELIEIQSELKAPKGQYNSFGKYKYRSAEDILEAVKPLLAKNHCHLTLTDEVVMVGDRYYVKATAILTNGEDAISTTAYAREDLDKKGMDGSQITGTASSYARKYALNGLFCIDDTKDADTDEYKNQQKAVKKASTAQVKQLKDFYGDRFGEYLQKNGFTIEKDIPMDVADKQIKTILQ
jgi:hypothetical protein